MQQVINQAYAALNSHLEKGGNLTCKQCEGSGKITISVSTFGKIDESKHEMSCVSCSGHGQFSLSSEKDRSDWVSAEIHRNMWCACDQETEFYYMEDNQCEGCISKHHYHCENCGLITQVG